MAYLGTRGGYFVALMLLAGGMFVTLNLMAPPGTQRHLGIHAASILA